MGGSLRVGRVLGFEVRLDYSWFLVLAIFTAGLGWAVFPSVYEVRPPASWVLGFGATLLLFASVLVHELAHAVAARRCGVAVQSITLFLFGGIAQIKDDPPSPRAEVLIAAAGPLVSVLVGLAALGASLAAPESRLLAPAVVLTNYVGWANILLAVFNMVPGFPLDGGRLLRGVLWAVTGNFRLATRWASAAGQLFGAVLMAYGLIFRVLLAHQPGGFWLVFVGWFLYSAARAAYEQHVLRHALHGLAASSLMASDVPQVDADLRVPGFVDQYVLRYDQPAYPVVRDGEMTGLIVVDDVRKLDRELWGVTSIGVLARTPDTMPAIDDSVDAWDAVLEMTERDLPRLLVLREGELVGFLSRDSVGQAIRRRLDRRFARRGDRTARFINRERARSRGWAP
jgi:Zn-dependent protease/CBS domain-containing protein